MGQKKNPFCFEWTNVFLFKSKHFWAFVGTFSPLCAFVGVKMMEPAWSPTQHKRTVPTAISTLVQCRLGVVIRALLVILSPIALNHAKAPLALSRAIFIRILPEPAERVPPAQINIAKGHAS